ncbi:T9SS type A sorting domain-containing protein [Saprospira sp. CCB-QB6]|uniref:T9SS type A sorting domain-containing protein n=1 Tax=Saprospira sp. CCB-QB6 TaxID=3023936 RepID=UPI00234AAAEA|nr:T9SS type A sorting domain-containing protein [Saprospira sp. CCB-QB6]WCL81301.1 T9SS type A sorting domain-containing protein [Saprospira sp. CCB-QB6]
MKLITMMNKKFYLLLTLLFAQQLLHAQFGPAGVGNSSNNGLWLAADAIPAVADGTPISFWPDQSGNANHARHSVAGRQPTYVSNSNINGQPALLFDGANDQMIVNDADILDGSNGLTYFSVVRGNNIDGTPRGIFGKRITYTVNVEYAYTFFFWSGQQLNADVHTQNNRFATSNSFTNGVNYMPTLLFDGNLASNQRSKIYERGQLIRTASESSTTLPNSNQDLCLGALNVDYGTYFGGEYAELIQYNYALNSAQRVIVENYLAAKYNMNIARDYFSFKSTYGHEVAGIGRDDANNLHDDAQGSSFIRINNPLNMEDGEFLLWGHNNGDISTNNTTDVDGTIIEARLNRSWRVQETGDLGPVDIIFDVAQFNRFDLTDLRLLIDRDGDGFADNDVPVRMGTPVGATQILFATIDLQDGDIVTLGSINESITPLPLDLVHFEVNQTEKKNAQWTWQTAQEENLLEFELLHSLDGLDWQSETLIAARNQNETQNYNYLQEELTAGQHYFRLKIWEEDGSYSFSAIKTLFVESEQAALTLFPNPAKDWAEISSSQSLDNAQIQAFNSLGQAIPVHFQQNGQNLRLTISDWPAGQYIIRLEQNGIVRNLRLIKP